AERAFPSVSPAPPWNAFGTLVPLCLRQEYSAIKTRRSNMPDTRLGVGIVGCGYQGGRLVEAIGLGDDFAVVACADPDVAAATKLAAAAGEATIHASVEEMLQSADLDVV